LRRSRAIAGFALAVYAAGVLVAPVLHRLHHARYGADHVHGSTGTIYFGRDEAPPRPALDEAAHHAAFDADLAALDLTDVAHAGALTVACDLAPYTLASCPAALGGHPHTFGDELLARAHRHRGPPPFDPEHGRGASEHLAASLLATRVFMLAPPVRPVARHDLAPRVFSFVSTPRLAPACRGPPALA
jgi:hypothetical protein